MFECAREAMADILGLDSEVLPDWASWRAGEERPARSPDLTVLAIANDVVIGYGRLDVFDGRVGFHGLTAVRRAWRRRGIGRAMKTRQIALAKAAGLERLVTESQHANEPMRRLNESLGYGRVR
jgi:L-amino acid N-acyltransferase YncA